MNVEVLDPQGRLGRTTTWVAARATEAVAILGPRSGEVRVRLVGDDEMSAAHQRYQGIPGTTDVLTFDLTDRGTGPGGGAEGGSLDVDILACVDEARRQASDRGLPVEREVLLYIVHGVLHCLGHDDHTPEDAAAMHRREDEILAAIGVGATYAAAPSGGQAPGAATGREAHP